MNTFNRLPERAMDLATQVGEGIRDRVPDRALRWVETGAAIGALKTGSRVATRFARRNPTVLIAAAAGAGLLWYAAHRRAKQGENAAIEGSAKRVEAKRSSGTTGRRGGSRRKSQAASQSEPAAET
jgi:hypothetical protein